MCIFCSFSFGIESCAFFFVFLFYYSVLWKTANICFLWIFKSYFPFIKIIVNVSCFDLNDSKNIHVWRLFRIVKCKYATRRETFGKDKKNTHTFTCIQNLYVKFGIVVIMNWAWEKNDKYAHSKMMFFDIWIEDF